MYQLEPQDYGKVKPVFQPLDHFLAVSAILAGNVPGAVVYVDDVEHPRIALTGTLGRFYLAGAPDGAAFNADLSRFFLEKVYPEGRAAGAYLFSIYYTPDVWAERFEAILPDKAPLISRRRYLRSTARSSDWREALPDGFELRPVDADLLAHRSLERLDELEEELCSERPSVADFLARSFGVSLVHGNELVGWCLSEYNTGNRCEVGIATAEPYRRQGLATLMTQAFVEMAQAHGITEIGWHCYADNLGSVGTARKAGFEDVFPYASAAFYFNEALGLAVHGHHALREGAYADALVWYQRALALKGAPAWALWEAGCAYARLGDTSTAMEYLHRAVDSGFIHVDLYRQSEHLAVLRELPAWTVLMARLSAIEKAETA